MVSLKEVANLASVSLMTVSRAINTPEQLRPETYQRVMQAIEALNYVPDFFARKMRGNTTKTSTLAVLARDTATTPFSVEILLSIELTAREFGWNSFLVNLTSHEDSERAVNQLLAQRPDGIIFASMRLQQVTVPECLRDKNIVLANCVSENHTIPSYIPDDFEGQYQAMKVLLRRGYRRPLCIYLPESSLAGKARRAGVEKAWQESTLPPEQLRQYHLASGDEYYQDVISLLNRHCPDGKPDFDVLICGNDRIAFLAYQVLLAKGITIPQQVAVMGYDNMVGIGELFLPPLTTVQLPHYDIGREAALHLIERRESRLTHRLPCPLLERAST
ncbi:LacI family DNA-binding transcriptional regulator [Yersinia frederiksenii]|uniref:LacI family DNA-binding transcriptional regulator n=1 Tax=Yersinia frederiksenii TaxID=29484 RepID=UPI0011A2A721|nr:LacI family DNA-binding transcriptional regulator [Yersinia frederiksenii]